MLDSVPNYPIMNAITASSNTMALHVIRLAIQWPEFVRSVLSGTPCIIRLPKSMRMRQAVGTCSNAQYHNRDNVVSILDRLGGRRWRNMGSIPGGGRDVIFTTQFTQALRSTQASYKTVTRGHFPLEFNEEYYAARSSPSSAALRMRRTIPPLPHTPAWRP
jgi:hypothetical protein